MKTFTITIQVDEEVLRNSRGDDNKDESVIAAIEQEMGWVQQSGIYVKEVTPKIEA